MKVWRETGYLCSGKVSPPKLHINYKEQSGTLQWIRLANTTLINEEQDCEPGQRAACASWPAAPRRTQPHSVVSPAPQTQTMNPVMKKKADKSKLRDTVQSNRSELF